MLALALGAGAVAHAIEGSDRKRAVHHVAVEFAERLQGEDQSGACRLTVQELSGRCDRLSYPTPDCGVGPDGPPPPTPARTPREQIGDIVFDGERGKARLRPEERGKAGRAWLIMRRLEGRWRITQARHDGKRYPEPYAGRIFAKFFLGYCVQGDYRD